jgi:hypothetical protein
MIESRHARGRTGQCSRPQPRGRLGVGGIDPRLVARGLPAGRGGRADAWMIREIVSGSLAGYPSVREMYYSTMRKLNSVEDTR